MKPKRKKTKTYKSEPIDYAYNVEDAARYLRCSQATIYRLVKNNLIAYAQLEYGIRFSKYHLEKYFKDRIVLAENK